MVDDSSVVFLVLYTPGRQALNRFHGVSYRLEFSIQRGLQSPCRRGRRGGGLTAASAAAGRHLPGLHKRCCSSGGGGGGGSGSGSGLPGAHVWRSGGPARRRDAPPPPPETQGCAWLSRPPSPAQLPALGGEAGWWGLSGPSCGRGELRSATTTALVAAVTTASAGGEDER